MTTRFGRATAVFCIFLAGWGAAAALIAPASAKDLSAEGMATADRVEVHKAARKLYLYHGHQLLAEYKVSLGLAPVGQKERERDFKTPEGRYFLARRNTRSDYFLSIDRKSVV